MSAILYNSNSKLVSIYQRKHKITSSHELFNKQDLPFQSNNKIDSTAYLQELCLDAYPTSISRQIFQLPDWKLSIHSFFSLIFKNFILTWYGTKIPTKNDDFLKLLFTSLENILDYVDNLNLDWELILCEDIPFILEKHFTIMKQIVSENLTFNDFQKLYLYKNEYPDIIVSKLLASSENGSQIEKEFFKSLLGSLILDKIIGKIVEPFILIDGITSICKKVSKSQSNDAKVNIGADDQSFSRKIEYVLRTISHLIAHMSSSVNKSFTSFNKINQIPFISHYIFTVIKRTFRLDSRKPFLYYICKITQWGIYRVNLINHILQNIFNNIVLNKIITKQVVICSFIKLRHLLFPHDNLLGPGKEVPSPEKMMQLENECVQSIKTVCSNFKFTNFLNITDEEICLFVKCISRDKEMNKFVVHRIIDYMINKIV